MQFLQFIDEIQNSKNFAFYYIHIIISIRNCRPFIRNIVELILIKILNFKIFQL